MRRWLILGVLAALALLVAHVEPVSAQASFYEGKNVTVVIGATGGSLDVAARIVTRHLGKYIPGNPTVILQNMTGAAHLVATNHVYNVAKPDGLTLLAANPNVGIGQLTKVDAVRFDIRKFEWLGSAGADGVMLAIRAELPYKTWEEMKKADKELVVGTTGPGSNSHDFPLLLAEFAGAKFKFVSGYPANADVLLALERKEVDVWSAFGTTITLAADRGVVRPMVRGRVPVPGYEQLPVDENLATNPVGKAIMGIRAAPQAIGRAFAAPPGTPADRVKMLREAFAKTVRDPELLAEAKKAKIAFGYISPEEVLKTFNGLLDQTPEVQKEMVKYIKFGS
jgi:tripartite-type tricarboxylate transporter receptor subunit TctC